MLIRVQSLKLFLHIQSVSFVHPFLHYRSIFNDCVLLMTMIPSWIECIGNLLPDGEYRRCRFGIRHKSGHSVDDHMNDRTPADADIRNALLCVLFFLLICFVAEAPMQYTPSKLGR